MCRQRHEMLAAVLVEIWMIAGGSPAPAQGTAVPGDCPSADLQVTLNSGWDQSTGGALIPTGWDDDDWNVTVDASGGTTPRNADAINANPAWLTLPNSRWISAAATGPNGTYVYEMCWCMDDEADFFLNGNPIGSAPAGSFNDTIPTIVSVTDPTLFTTGSPDDEWVVTASPSGGTIPRPADVINTFAGWNVIPGTKWISADENGPKGTTFTRNAGAWPRGSPIR